MGRRAIALLVTASLLSLSCMPLDPAYALPTDVPTPAGFGPALRSALLGISARTAALEIAPCLGVGPCLFAAVVLGSIGVTAYVAYPYIQQAWTSWRSGTASSTSYGATSPGQTYTFTAPNGASVSFSYHCGIFGDDQACQVNQPWSSAYDSPVLCANGSHPGDVHDFGTGQTDIVSCLAAAAQNWMINTQGYTRAQAQAAVQGANFPTPAVTTNYYPGTSDPAPAQVKDAAAAATVPGSPAETDWANTWPTIIQGIVGQLIDGVNAGAGPATEAGWNSEGVTFAPTLGAESGAATATGDAAQTEQTGFLQQILAALTSILNAITQLPAQIANAIHDMLVTLFVPDEATIESAVTSVQGAYSTRIPFDLIAYVSATAAAIPSPGSGCVTPTFAFMGGTIEFSALCSVGAVVRPVALWAFAIAATMTFVKLLWPRLVM